MMSGPPAQKSKGLGVTRWPLESSGGGLTHIWWLMLAVFQNLRRVIVQNTSRGLSMKSLHVLIWASSKPGIGPQEKIKLSDDFMLWHQESHSIT